MTPSGLVLSIFPGIDLLGHAFEEQGYCVVRGPDLLWGGDIRSFHPPAGVFEGVIGGPPCKSDSNLAHMVRGHNHSEPKHQNMTPEFMRVVAEAEPAWWVMEAVIKQPAPHVLKLSPRWLGERQSRKRYFHSNLDLERYVEVALFEHPEFKHAVLARHGGAIGSVERGLAKYSLEDACELQGLQRDFTEHMPFTKQGKYEVIGNGVPMAMGRAVAKAVRRAAA